MPSSFFIDIKRIFLNVLFPASADELVIARLNERFPLHLSTHTLIDRALKKEYRVTALADYGNKKVVALVRTLKYSRNTSSIKLLADVLGDYLLETVAQHTIVKPGTKLMIMPVPLSRQRMQERGFNQVTLLLSTALKSCPELEAYIVFDALLKHKDTVSQTRLSRKERLTNVVGAFGISSKHISLANTDVLLIDDVLTTGATALEASRTLMHQGARSVEILAIARTL